MSDPTGTQRRPTCAFRVDASLEMGTGHLRRCLTLAGELAVHGIRSTFVCRPLADELVSLVRNAGHELTMLPVGRGAGAAGDSPPAHSHWLHATQAQDAEQTRDALGAWRPDWLIVDHYALDRRWECALRPDAARLMVIDDLADRSHECDLLLDQNYYRDLRERYRGRVNPECRQLLGPRYALTRREFLSARAGAANRSGRVGRILIFFGGADADNYTQLALQAIDGLGRPDLQVDVLSGALNPHNRELGRLCARRPNTRLLTEVGQVADLMLHSDIAVGAGGGASWERCCLGLPTVLLVTADNQRRLTHDLCEAGYALCTSVEGGVEAQRQLGAMIAALLSSESLVRNLSRRCAELVDGLGARRVAAVMRSAALSVRLATEADRERVYAWRNHPAVRRQSRHPQPLDPQTHAGWFAAALRDPARVLLIAEVEGLPLGVVRFDISAHSGEVSIYLAPDHHGGGWGGEVLRCAEEWLRGRHPEVGRLVAEVLPGNPASAAMFNQSGYREGKSVLVKTWSAA